MAPVVNELARPAIVFASSSRPLWGCSYRRDSHDASAPVDLPHHRRVALGHRHSSSRPAADVVLAAVPASRIAVGDDNRGSGVFLGRGVCGDRDWLAGNMPISGPLYLGTTAVIATVTTLPFLVD